MGNRICMLLSNPFTNDNRVLREAKTLVGAGYAVTIICPKCNQDLPDEEIIEGIKVVRILQPFLPFFPRNLFEYRECRLFLRRAVQEKADVYHCHDVDTLIYGALASRRNSSVYVYDSHEYWRDKSWTNVGLIYRFILKLYIGASESLFSRGAKLVITVGDRLADALRTVNRLREKPLVLRNCPELKTPEKFGWRDGRFSAKDRVFVYVGAFIEDRGLEWLISSMASLDKNYKLMMVGYGPLKVKLVDLASANKRRDRVFFHDKIIGSAVVNFCSEADIGIIATQATGTSHKYSLPNKLFDYIMAGIPVLSTDLPEIKNIINEYGIGSVYNQGDSDSYLSAADGLIDNYTKMKNNTKKASLELNWEAESQKLVNAYREIGESYGK